VETDLIARLIDLAPVIAVLILYIQRLEARHQKLMEAYITLHARYIRDIRAWAKLPADEFADDLDAPLRNVDFGTPG
jgi:acyl-homoserine lactone acylase PvdQ